MVNKYIHTYRVVLALPKVQKADSHKIWNNIISQGAEGKKLPSTNILGNV